MSFFPTQRAFSKYTLLMSGNTIPLMDLSWAKHEDGPDRRRMLRPATLGRFHQTHKSPCVLLTAAVFPPAVNTVDARHLSPPACVPHPSTLLSPPSVEARRCLCDRLFLRGFAEGQGKGEKTSTYSEGGGVGMCYPKVYLPLMR